MVGNKGSLHRALRAARNNGLLLLAVALVLTGLLILATLEAKSPVMTAIGTTLVATGTLSAGWNLLVGRYQDGLQRAAIHEAVASRWSGPEEGLVRVGLGVFTHSELRQALDGCLSLRAACLYDPHWLEREWADPLRDFFTRRGTKAQFILPDPKDLALMNHLGQRHGLEPDSDGLTAAQQMEVRVRELTRQLTRVAAVRPSALEVAYVQHWGPSYTCYLFSRRKTEGLGVTRQYGHKMGTGTALPEILFAEGGSLWTHADEDFKRLVSRTVA